MLKRQNGVIIGSDSNSDERDPTDFDQDEVLCAIQEFTPIGRYNPTKVVTIYIVGSLQRISDICAFSDRLRSWWTTSNFVNKTRLIVNDSWTAHGPYVDINYWEYAQKQNWSYDEAIRHPVSRAVFELDKKFINEADIVIMLQPCGRSASLELGYAAGTGTFTAIVKAQKDYDKVEVMEQFADIIYGDTEEFFNETQKFFDSYFCSLL